LSDRQEHQQEIAQHQTGVRRDLDSEPHSQVIISQVTAAGQGNYVHWLRPI
jgi:hypothetical protein